MTTAYCCFIDPDRAALVAVGSAKLAEAGIPTRAIPGQCDGTAEYLITDGDSPDDYTHACVDHVGHLLRDGRISTVTSLLPNEIQYFSDPRVNT